MLSNSTHTSTLSLSKTILLLTYCLSLIASKSLSKIPSPNEWILLMTLSLWSCSYTYPLHQSKIQTQQTINQYTPNRTKLMNCLNANNNFLTYISIKYSMTKQFFIMPHPWWWQAMEICLNQLHDSAYTTMQCLDNLAPAACMLCCRLDITTCYGCTSNNSCVANINEQNPIALAMGYSLFWTLLVLHGGSCSWLYWCMASINPT